MNVLLTRRIQRILVDELDRTVEQIAPLMHRSSQKIFQIVTSAVSTIPLTAYVSILLVSSFLMRDLWK